MLSKSLNPLCRVFLSNHLIIRYAQRINRDDDAYDIETKIRESRRIRFKTKKSFRRKLRRFLEVDDLERFCHSDKSMYFYHTGDGILFVLAREDTGSYLGVTCWPLGTKNDITREDWQAVSG